MRRAIISVLLCVGIVFLGAVLTLKALANRLFPLIARVGMQPEVLMVGGVSQSQTLRRYLDELLGFPTRLPQESEFLSAIGAAMIAAQGSST